MRGHRERRVTRIGNEDLVVGVQQHAHGKVKTLLGACSDVHAGWVDAAAHANAEARCECLAQGSDSLIRGVVRLIPVERCDPRIGYPRIATAHAKLRCARLEQVVPNRNLYWEA